MISPEDRWEIADLLSKYCLAADTRELGLLDEVFTHDIECVFQTGSCSGIEDVRTFMASVLDRLTATQHNVTTSLVTATEAGAQGRTHLIVQHVRTGTDGGDTYAMGGTYHDLFRREAAGWRICRRELVGSWRVGNPAVMR